MNKKIFFFLICCAFTGLLQAQQMQSLAGKWQFKLDAADEGISGDWASTRLPDQIFLPGTTDEAGYGEKTSGSDFGILTREYKYCGPAWYQRDIHIPDNWKGKKIMLKLERVLWESRVYIDGTEVSLQDALNSPHWHELGVLSPGKHTLTIRVNNDLIYNIGDKGHMYTEYTQSIWNGIVGDILLIAQEPVRFTNPQVYTHVSPCSLRITDSIVNETGRNGIAVIDIRLYERGSEVEVFSANIKYPLKGMNNLFTYSFTLPEGIKLWCDVNPNLYTLKVELSHKESRTVWTEDIGFREVSTSSSKIEINGKPVFMRGNLDCVHFPLTGYPPCTTEEWERIFLIYKDYGLNHVRFHSWCPPKAAFAAADRVGIYIQAEVIWIDWWMTNTPPDRKDMITKGSPEGLGKNPSADEFVQKELSRMLDVYGNHPSFIMQCIGNELGNSDFEIMESWMKPLKEKDSRRLYSVSTARKIMPLDQYMATHHIQGLGNTRGLRGASTDWDFEDVYKQATIPILSHEIGQWPVYPRWEEIKKYKGVLKARNFEEFREVARRNKIEEQNESFVAASGALNQLLYKYEIESFLRTPSCAGIQLLSMQDYQGQGEALIGWLDAFYDSKGITTPEKFRNHMDTTVALLRLPKFVWKNNEVLTAKVQLAHYGTEPLHDLLYWKIKDEDNILLATGGSSTRTYPVGSAEIITEIRYDLKHVTSAKKLTVEVGLQNTPVVNQWHIWVYPAIREERPQNDVYITNRMDAECVKRLEKGEKVLLLANELGNEETADKISFYPLYWSLTFFPGQGKNTIGMCVQDKHPLFLNFPTDYHSDWQWESIYKGGRAFYINDYPESYRPVAQPVDDFHRNNKLASIFELKAGKGKLVVCGFDLTDEDNPAAGQLKRSILHYMNSADFNPEHEQPISRLREMLVYVQPLESTLPGEFKNALLYADCNKQEGKRGTNLDMNAEKTENNTWVGEELTFTIDCPQGMIGTLFVCFEDEDKKGREGSIVFEGRNFEFRKQNETSSWIKFHVMREDSNDGKLLFKAKVKKGSDLRISRIALVEE